MYKRALLPFVIFVSTLSTCFSQGLPVLVLKGVITNASTGEVISYATVRVSKNGITAMSNENGRFIFKIPVGNKNDSVYISHIGYKPATIAINPSDTGLRVIKLQEEINQLTEVVVRTINPLDLIKKAIERIPDNYPMTPYLLSGFYRLSGTKEKNIIDLSEAVFTIYNETYATKNKQLKLIKSRFDLDGVAFNGRRGIRIGEKPENIFEDDIVSNADASGLLSKQGLKDHHFTFRGMINYNGREAYEISFDQRDGVKKCLYRGKLILDADNLAFLEFDLRLSPKGIQYWDPGFAKKIEFRLMGISYSVLQSEEVVTYRKYGGKYYLDHVKGISLSHWTGGRDHFDINPLRLSYNYLVTGIDTTGIVAFKKEEVMGNRKGIEGRSPDSPDSTEDKFWESYNLIQAEFNVDSATKIIRAKNAILEYKRILEDKLLKYKKDKTTRIDSILSFYHQKDQFNGMALVQYQGKTLYEKGFGLANIENNIPNTPKTQFRIGSTSKQFTSLLIMQLVNENRLNVHDSAGKFLPGYANGRVTIQQLLTHQSGIPNYTENEEYLAKIVTRKYSLDELVRQFCSDSLEFEPGAKFRYTNSGYVVLADIIEKVTGKRYADVLAERIFIPLGMKNSYFGTAAHDTTNLAVGYMYGQHEMAYPVENIAGAGAITSSAEDLLLWANGLSSGVLLPKEQMDELFLPRVEWHDWDAYYGYGWMIDRFLFAVSGKHTVQYHPGTELGFYTMLVRQPDKGIVIILLNNSSDFPRFDMTDLILDELN